MYESYIVPSLAAIRNIYILGISGGRHLAVHNPFHMPEYTDLSILLMS